MKLVIGFFKWVFLRPAPWVDADYFGRLDDALVPSDKFSMYAGRVTWVGDEYREPTK